jgi:hypothetical protein
MNRQTPCDHVLVVPGRSWRVQLIAETGKCGVWICKAMSGRKNKVLGRWCEGFWIVSSLFCQPDYLCMKIGRGLFEQMDFWKSLCFVYSDQKCYQFWCHLPLITFCTSWFVLATLKYSNCKLHKPCAESCPWTQLSFFWNWNSWP